TFLLSFRLFSPSLPTRLSLSLVGVLPAVILSLCFLVGLPGNISVIILKPNFQQLSSMTQSLMLNLAVSDLLCLLTLPLWIYNLLYSWIFGLMACKILSYLIYCSVYRSLLTIVFFQRYMLVVHQQLQTKMRLLLVLLWLVSLILSIPVLVVRQEIPDEQWLHCRNQYSSQPQKLAVLLAETLVGFASSAFFNNPQTSRLVTSIIIVFFVLWIPYHTMNVLSVGATAFHDARLDKLSSRQHTLMPSSSWPGTSTMQTPRVCFHNSMDISTSPQEVKTSWTMFTPHTKEPTKPFPSPTWAPQTTPLSC
uniref:G-protein coupled receptors family 1 profile domain-containing protein n=1 Tax=Oryzias latipes TaxID=8090 RepID=A0A3P9IJ29_ORYLA